MQGISAPDILWHTNVLLAILCDTKRSVRQRDPFQPIAAHRNPEHIVLNLL